MRVFRLNRTLHRWLSLIVGVQVLIWVGTGIYFNVVDLEAVNGNQQRQPMATHGTLVAMNLLPVHTLTSRRAQRIELVWRLGRPFYQFDFSTVAHGYFKRDVTLFDAQTGAEFTITKDNARSLALQSYTGNGQIVSVHRLKPPIDALPKQQNPVWQVVMDDPQNTAIYVNAMTGDVTAHITDARRIRDLMFRLHFMDYANTGNFNHGLIIVFAVLALLLSVTGVYWLVKLMVSGNLFPVKKRSEKIVASEPAVADSEVHDH